MQGNNVFPEKQPAFDLLILIQIQMQAQRIGFQVVHEIP